MWNFQILKLCLFRSILSDQIETHTVRNICARKNNNINHFDEIAIIIKSRTRNIDTQREDIPYQSNPVCIQVLMIECYVHFHIKYLNRSFRRCSKWENTSNTVLRSKRWRTTNVKWMNKFDRFVNTTHNKKNLTAHLPI